MSASKYILPKLPIVVGKSVRAISKLRGGGTALPGLVVEKLDPEFLARTLANLPYGVVLISGTNGKTTTTKIVTELLKSQGLRVFTNRSGSNFTRGVVASLLESVPRSGKLDADIAVLELDEAHAVHFVRAVQPRYSLLLNVMRDQLDRFGEIDATAEMLRQIAVHTTEAVVINADDPRLIKPSFLSSITAKQTAYFGVAPELQVLFPSDDQLRRVTTDSTTQKSVIDATRLVSLDGTSAVIDLGGQKITTEVKLTGVYNTLNGVASLALVKAVLGDTFDQSVAITALANVTPAFGRGEVINIGGIPVELVLVKNPSGFRLGLSSFDAKSHSTMIAINDNYADGRDMSWLWDVDFSSLKERGVRMVSGSRCHDMALRLQYDEVAVRQTVPKLSVALNEFMAANTRPKRIYCTYTAMLSIRRELAKKTTVKAIHE